ncbi:MAG: hypothetical protein HC869_25185 [Rhodospirillales bacterium]|nr:hypothetical protein [Rhodospirillales bacterium]
MGRTIVLVGCLVTAGAVAAYTHYSERSSEQVPVYTVHTPHRPADPAAIPNPGMKAGPTPVSQKTAVNPGDRASLTRQLQRELKRVGCYSGEISGVWTTSSRMAMKSFTDNVNASLPIDNPDPVLLSLVQGHRNIACAAQCPSGQMVAESGRCTPTAVLAKSLPTSELEPPADKATITTGTIVPATAAAATALTAAAATKGELKAKDRPRATATSPTNSDTPPRSGRADRSAPQSGPVPAKRVYERRPRRKANSPPKFVRNLFRALGIN